LCMEKIRRLHGQPLAAQHAMLATPRVGDASSTPTFLAMQGHFAHSMVVLVFGQVV
jgi:hypothetical protein